MKAMKTSIDARLARRWIAPVSALCLAFVVGCASTNVEPTGGETHFLKLCAPDNSEDVCGKGLDCICGVCTLLCDEPSTCSATFASAECVPRAASDDSEQCGGGPQSNRCEVHCTGDDECEAISPSHVCSAGVCRVGMSPVPPDPPDAAPDADSGAAGDGAVECTPADIAASEVLLLGDSFFASSHEIGEQLVATARSAGALAEDESYRDASRLPDNALAYMGEGIRDQYEGARDESPVTVVVMNGGGADALWAECEPEGGECPELVAAADALRGLFVTMADDGVTDVVFVGYPDPIPAAARAAVTFLRPLLKDACDTAPTRCHWLDLLPLFDGHYETYINDGGLDPTLEGATVTAEAIWDLMNQRCIAR